MLWQINAEVKEEEFHISGYFMVYYLLILYLLSPLSGGGGSKVNAANQLEVEQEC